MIDLAEDETRGESHHSRPMNLGTNWNRNAVTGFQSRRRKL